MGPCGPGSDLLVFLDVVEWVARLQTRFRHITTTIELPRVNRMWEPIEALMRNHEPMTVDLDGCAVGAAYEGTPLLKPWRLMTTDHRIAKMFEHCKCDGTHEHLRIR